MIAAAAATDGRTVPMAASPVASYGRGAGGCIGVGYGRGVPSDVYDGHVCSGHGYDGDSCVGGDYINRGQGHGTMSAMATLAVAEVTSVGSDNGDGRVLRRGSSADRKPPTRRRRPRRQRRW